MNYNEPPGCERRAAGVRTRAPHTGSHATRLRHLATVTLMQRFALLVVSIALLNACGGRTQPRVSPPPPEPAAGVPIPPAARVTLIRVRTTEQGRSRVLAMPIEDYVWASVLSEVTPPAGNPDVTARVFEIQAIVARTYALASRGRHATDGFDVCDTTHCQLVDLERPRKSRWATIARQVVDATEGRVLYYRDAPAAALFHADCGGFLAAASDVWGGAPVSYLTARADPLPGGATHLSWTYSVAREQLRVALNADSRTAVGERLDTIDVQSRDPSGRARLVLLNGARAPLVRGDDLRAVVGAALGARSIRSARFDVRRDGERFIFTGQGFGHGVGLCQIGALARVMAGESVEQILDFYYPHTKLR